MLRTALHRSMHRSWMQEAGVIGGCLKKAELVESGP